MKYPIGLRKPGTKEGTWTGAYVAGAESLLGPIFEAVFEDGKDFVAAHRSWFPVYRAKAEFIKQGWKPMTRQDIRKTSGI